MLGMLLFGAALLNEKGKEASARAQIAKRDREIAAMDVWDGIEKQIKDHMAFYNREENKLYECGAYWKGDKSKWSTFSLMAVDDNREYWNSGLSADEFACRCFLKRYEEKGKNMFWSMWNPYTKLKLYNHSGEYAEYTCYDGWEKKDGKLCSVMEISTGGKIIAKIPM